MRASSGGVFDSRSASSSGRCCRPRCSGGPRCDVRPAPASACLPRDVPGERPTLGGRGYGPYRRPRSLPRPDTPRRSRRPACGAGPRCCSPWPARSGGARNRRPAGNNSLPAGNNSLPAGNNSLPASGSSRIQGKRPSWPYCRVLRITWGAGRRNESGRLTSLRWRHEGRDGGRPLLDFRPLIR